MTCSALRCSMFNVQCSMFTIALLASGCTAPRDSDPRAEGPDGIFQPASARDVSARHYKVAPPDKLIIRSPGIQRLDGLVTTIRPDGYIQLNLLGEVYVVGQTPRQIAAALTELATRFYNNPQILVDVAEYNSQFYEVFGTAVRDPGRKPYTGRNTVVAALCEAGFNERAWPQQVHVSRPAKQGQQRVTAIIDMKHIYTTGDTRQNYLLEEGDIVYVPPSPLREWNDSMQKVLGPLTGGQQAVQIATPTMKTP